MKTNRRSGDTYLRRTHPNRHSPLATDTFRLSTRQQYTSDVIRHRETHGD